MSKPDPDSMQNKFQCLMCSCIFIGCAFGFFAGLRSWQEETQLSKRGITVSGVIKARERIDSDTYYIAYCFSVLATNANTQHCRTESVDFSVYDALAKIRYVNVLILPENPSVFRLELAGLMTLRSASSIVICFVAGALSLLTIFCLATGWSMFGPPPAPFRMALPAPLTIWIRLGVRRFDSLQKIGGAAYSGCKIDAVIQLLDQEGIQLKLALVACARIAQR